MTIRRLLLLLILGVTVLVSRAQEKEYMYEVGAGFGSSWSYGDVNKTKALYDPSSSFSLIWRYNLNLRWALTTELQYSGISGSSSDFDYAFPSAEAYDYDMQYWQLAFIPEIHFWNYGWGSDYREKKRYTPYLCLGVSAGVVTGGDEGSTFAFGIPMGLGYKFKMAKRWNAQLTALFTKCFSDRLDGAIDPEGIKTSSLMGNDWLASIRLSVTFDFKERCIECHNQQNKAR